MKRKTLTYEIVDIATFDYPEASTKRLKPTTPLSLHPPLPRLPRTNPDTAMGFALTLAIGLHTPAKMMPDIISLIVTYTTEEMWAIIESHEDTPSSVMTHLTYTSESAMSFIRELKMDHIDRSLVQYGKSVVVYPSTGWLPKWDVFMHFDRRLERDDDGNVKLIPITINRFAIRCAHGTTDDPLDEIYEHNNRPRRGHNHHNILVSRCAFVS